MTPLHVELQDRREIFAEIAKTFPTSARIADIGAGHCIFSIEAAKMGFRPTAIDVRTERIPIESLKQYKIEFIEADINRYELAASDYDVILLLGILYHLTLDEQIRLLKLTSSKITVVDTHYSHRPMVKQGEYEGQIYLEDESLRKDSRSAWTSSDSFWHSLPSLERLAIDCGYSKVTIIEPDYQKGRTFFIFHPKAN